MSLHTDHVSTRLALKKPLPATSCSTGLKTKRDHISPILLLLSRIELHSKMSIVEFARSCAVPRSCQPFHLDTKCIYNQLSLHLRIEALQKGGPQGKTPRFKIRRVSIRLSKNHTFQEYIYTLRRSGSVYHVLISPDLLMNCVSTIIAPHFSRKSSTHWPGRTGLPMQNIVDPLPDMRTCSKPRPCSKIPGNRMSSGDHACILKRRAKRLLMASNFPVTKHAVCHSILVPVLLHLTLGTTSHIEVPGISHAFHDLYAKTLCLHHLRSHMNRSQ